MRGQAQIDDEHYRVRSRLEVIALLRALMDDEAPLTLGFGEAGDSEGFIVTAVLAVLPDEGMLVLDCGADGDAARRVLDASDLKAVAKLDDIHVEFDTPYVEQAVFDGRPALQCPLPTSLMRLQRREAYRLRIPANRAAHCRISHARGAQAGASIRVFDISVSGFALIDVPAGLSLDSGTVLKNCCIVLPEIGPVTSDVEIVHCVEMQSPDTRTTRRYGCRFLHLSQATVTQIQRYINRVEREQIVHG